MLNIAKSKGVERFIYVSSGSVYGINEDPNVNEDAILRPLTIYSKTKAMSEEIVRAGNTPDFTTVIIRPGTTCGYSPRLRLDLIVNILTENAINKGRMIIKGGDQMRPSINIEDITDYYVKLIEVPKEKIAGKTFNASNENYSINQIANKVLEVVGNNVKIDRLPNPDQRSYPMVSDKIAKVLGFYPKYTVKDAIVSLKQAFEKGSISNPSDSIYKNIDKMRELGIGIKKSKIKYVDLSLQHKPQRDMIIRVLESVLQKGDFILGSSVEEFEKKIAEYCSTKYALAVNSGTDAIFLALKSYGIKEGDEVITVSNSFIATAGAIVQCNAKPVFVDVGEDYLIDVNKIESAITKNTKVILPVHLTGRAADMYAIMNIAQKYNLKVIEDAAQAIGSYYDNKRTGNLGHVGCFSLHPLKILNVIGDGGFITTNDEDVYDKIKKLRNHGLKNRDEFDYFGYNSRLDTFQAAIAIEKLSYLEDFINRRKINWNLYFDNLKDITSVKLPKISKLNENDNANTFMIQAENRDNLLKFLEENNISAKIHYPIPIHLQKGAEYLGYKKGSLPETEKQSQTIISLPVHQDLTKEEIFRVIELIKKFYNK
jgi:dTDP-4-amino-4,6-dideoxygalactose transaminase